MSAAALDNTLTPATHLPTLDTLATQLQSIQAQLAPLLNEPLSAHSVGAPLANAKLYGGLAYTLSTLFYMYLKVKGQNPSTHSIKQELARVKQYMSKITSAEQKQQAIASLSTDSNEESTTATTDNSTAASLRVDKDSATRFINAALNKGKAKGKGKGQQQSTEREADEAAAEQPSEQAEQQDEESLDVWADENSVATDQPSSSNNNPGSGNKNKRPSPHKQSHSQKKKKSKK